MEEYLSQSDEELAGISVQDHQAFAVLVERYQAPLLRYIQRITSVSVQDAEDLLQDAFLKIFSHLNGFDRGLKFSSWAYRITHNVVISEYRKRSVRAHGNTIDIEQAVLEQFASELNAKDQKLSSYMALPDLITDATQFIAFQVAKNTPNFVSNKNITSGVVLLNNSNFDRDYQILSDKIVLIESADPGFDWIFGAKISGLITMYGGANSHMAIRAAEYKLPAAIGVGKELFGLIANAKSISLKCNDRRIEIHK